MFVSQLFQSSSSFSLSLSLALFSGSMGTSETTEWEDIQRKFGNLPPKELIVEEDEVVNLVENAAGDFTGDHKFDHVNWDELELLGDTVAEDEERLLEEIRCVFC